MGSGRSCTLSVAALFCIFWTIDGKMPEVRGKVNGVAELTCSVGPPRSADVSSGRTLHVVEWLRQGLDIPVLIQFGSYPPRVHPQYEGRVSLVDSSTLKLEGLLLDDQGPYECRILLIDKPSEELRNGTWTMLSVIAAPSFTKTPPAALEALVGGHLSLVCAAVGNPLPTITWLKDGSVIQTGNDQEGALSLTAVSVQSAGQYTCHASNSEGNATLETTVKIKGPPVIVVPPKSTSVNVSQDALLHCQALADPSNMTYVWLKGGENVYHLQSLKSRVKIMVDGTLLISSLTPDDSGNYTCAPTNGLLTPPTASAILTVMHPAQALAMPLETYLPTGMDGMVHCPLMAQPPLLRVDWTKDGKPLDLSLYPGWTVTPEGNLLMATVNDDAEGVFTCTPFNSYGSMGQSGPTQVILQDPPSFSVTPEKQYKQKVGRTLLIPCQGNDGSAVKVSWTKVDLARHRAYSVTHNGSLLLRPLAKDHHGMWECSLSNRVALVKAFTQIFVLGTSPHAATSLSVSPGMKQANVSWVEGFDGGSAQTFSVWVKKISARDNEGKQEWFSVPVPSISGATLLVTGLSPATEYQFSLLSHNKVGAGPFSEIATARTLDPSPSRSGLQPPSSLSANLGPAGVVLHWSLPQAQALAVTGFVLQSRIAEQGAWIDLDDDIRAHSREILVPGLQKDCVYELRLLTRRGELLSEPSPSLNVSTVGTEMYPSSSRLLESPEPLLAGILGGVAFMGLVLVLLLGSACLVSRRRNRRNQTKQNEPPPAIYKRSSSIKISDSGSVLKKSLLPASALYPVTSSTMTSSSSSSSSASSNADCSSFNSETRHHKRQLLSKNRRSPNQFQCRKSGPVSPSVELITRSPDGRFVTAPHDTLNAQNVKSTKHNRPFTLQKSAPLCSEQRDGQNPPFVLSVDLAPCKQSEWNTSRQTCDMTRHPDPGVFDRTGNDDGSFCHRESATSPTFPALPHLRSGLGRPSTTASALVLQMEHERERGNLSHCLKLAQEREELARELQKYRAYRCSEEERRREKPAAEKGDNELFQGYGGSRTLPRRNRHSDGEHPPPSSTAEIPLRCEGADHSAKKRLPPPHLSQTTRHGRVRETPQGCADVVPPSTFSQMQTHVSSPETLRQRNPSPHCRTYGERSDDAEEEIPEPAEQNAGIEMSADEPAFEARVTQPARKPAPRRGFAPRAREGCPGQGRRQEMRRSASFRDRAETSAPRLRRVVSHGSKPWGDSERQRHGRQNHADFLTPDAWVDSLSRDEQSHSSALKADTDRQSSIPSNSANVPSASQTTHHLPPATYPPTSNPLQKPIVIADQTLRDATWPDEYQEGIKNAPGCYSGSTMNFSRNFLPDDNKPHKNRGALNSEAEVYEEVPDCGSSYSSFASSGRGSMEPANGRSSLSHFSTKTASSPETLEEDGQSSTVDMRGHRMEKGHRKPSVDENYEWDEADICSQSGNRDGLLPPLNRRNVAALCSPPSTEFSTNFNGSSSLQGHQSSRCASPQPDTVLF